MKERVNTLVFDMMRRNISKGPPCGSVKFIRRLERPAGRGCWLTALVDVLGSKNKRRWSRKGLLFSKARPSSLGHPYYNRPPIIRLVGLIDIVVDIDDKGNGVTPGLGHPREGTVAIEHRGPSRDPGMRAINAHIAAIDEPAYVEDPAVGVTGILNPRVKRDGIADDER